MKWSARPASRVAYLIAKILYSGNFSAMVSPFRPARFDYAHVADSFARSAFGSASVVAAPSLLASDQADYTAAPIAVHAGLIFNGPILSAGGQEAGGIRLALRIF